MFTLAHKLLRKAASLHECARLQQHPQNATASLFMLYLSVKYTCEAVMESCDIPLPDDHSLKRFLCTVRGQVLPINRFLPAGHPLIDLLDTGYCNSRIALSTTVPPETLEQAFATTAQLHQWAVKFVIQG